MGADEQIMAELSGLAGGFDVYGRRIPYEQQLAAVQQLEVLKKRREEAALARDRFNAGVDIEQNRLALEKSKLDIEHRKLDIDQDRVANERAEIIVKALAVAAQAGIPGEKLLEAISGLSDKLLSGPEIRQITERK